MEYPAPKQPTIYQNIHRWKPLLLSAMLTLMIGAAIFGGISSSSVANAFDSPLFEEAEATRLDLFDFSIDKDRDGLPDEFVAGLDRLDAMRTAGHSESELARARSVN